MNTFYTLMVAAGLLLSADITTAQTPITKANTISENASSSLSYTAPGASGSSFSGTTISYHFGQATQNTGNSTTLKDFTIGNEVYTYALNANSSVKLRRVNNPVVSGNRTLLWVEGKPGDGANNVSVVNAYNDNMEAAFSRNSLNQGTDNLFQNQGDGNGNSNNIERLDVVFAGGMISTINTKVGFALFERGNDNDHDGFVIAAITAVDLAGNATSYGKQLRVTSGNYGNLPGSSLKYYVVRRDLAVEATLKMSTSGNQNIGGVYISLDELGIANGDKIYGYSVFSSDLPTTATSADMVDYTNPAFFPTNTGSDKGGIDLMALTGILSMPNAVILPPTAENIINPGIWHDAPITAIKPLDATAASGTIISYTIKTIPNPARGTLYTLSNGISVPVSIGQVLTPDQINTLAFKPVVGTGGNAVFYYSATDSYGQVSNTASYTIPVLMLEVSLPVKLTGFTGNINNKNVNLNWQTSQEINSSYFEVQRSSDGNSFEPFATFTAKEFSNVATNYSANDDLYHYTESNVFYRLKMVDVDGKFIYSNIVMLKVNGMLTTNTIAWPNPTNGKLNVQLNSDMNGTAQLKLSGIDGKVWNQSNAIIKKGQNVIRVNQAQSLPAGTYILNIISAVKTETIKIIKL
ncbi:MAG: T9SS type A sorting domain-containing protein [Ferruginibacter sp.]